jgi:serine/threonine protein kinase
MRKDVILDMNSLQSVNLERLILLQVNHPFIVKMHYVFQRKHRVYFVMDYVPGGEFFSYMQQIRRFKQSQVAFYAAQIALALGYLHSSDIIYRDLKPENILLDQQGYIVLSDFGLAKQAKESNTFCGTPEYISPEMLLATGHDHTVDWWALGILIYEMLTGVPPFYDKNRNRMFLNIEKAQLRWPDPDVHKITVSPEAKDLISKLLVKDRMQRLGQRNDATEILNHPFFQEIDLERLFNKELSAPLVPQTADPAELRQSV